MVGKNRVVLIPISLFMNEIEMYCSILIVSFEFLLDYAP